MSKFLVVIGFAALPALANFLGGGLAEVFRVSGRSLSLALHLAAGIVLAVVGLELMPEALQANPPWVPLLAFVAGGAVSSAWTGWSATCRDVSAGERTSQAPWRSSAACRWTCSATA